MNNHGEPPQRDISWHQPKKRFRADGVGGKYFGTRLHEVFATVIAWTFDDGSSEGQLCENRCPGAFIIEGGNFGSQLRESMNQWKAFALQETYCQVRSKLNDLRGGAESLDARIRSYYATVNEADGGKTSSLELQLSNPLRCSCRIGELFAIFEVNGGNRRFRALAVFSVDSARYEERNSDSRAVLLAVDTANWETLLVLRKSGRSHLFLVRMSGAGLIPTSRRIDACTGLAASELYVQTSFCRWLFGGAAPPTLPALLSGSHRVESLNRSQQDALDQFLVKFTQSSSSLTCVQGPPGTGKTYFVAYLVKKAVSILLPPQPQPPMPSQMPPQLPGDNKRKHRDFDCEEQDIDYDDGSDSGNYARSKNEDGSGSGTKVMITGPSNKSVVVAAERYLAVGGGSLSRVCIVGADDRLFDAAGDNLSINDPSINLSSLLQAIKNPTQVQFIMPWVLTDLYLGALDRFLSHLKQVAQGLSRKERMVLCDTNLHKAIEIGEFLGLHKISKDQKLKEAFSSMMNVNLDAADVIRDLHRALKTISHTSREIISKHCVMQSAVVFATLSGCGSSKMKAMHGLELLVVDEAAQAAECDIFIPLSGGKQPKHLVLAGDPGQLGCFVESERLKTLGYGTSTLSRLIELEPRFPYSLLSQQYRMHPEISQFPNAIFYQGRLSDETTYRPAPAWFANLRSPLLCRPLIFLHQEGQEEKDRRHSWRNESEVTVVRGVVQELLDARVSPASIIVVTFYSGQVNALKTEFQRNWHGSGLNEVAIHTVDSIQGSEADVVILSFVRSNFRDNTGFLKDYRRLNVAITRAKHQLICVGNLFTLYRSKFRLRVEDTAGAEGRPADNEAEVLLRALNGLAENCCRRNLVHWGVHQPLVLPPLLQ